MGRFMARVMLFRELNIIINSGNEKLVPLVRLYVVELCWCFETSLLPDKCLVWMLWKMGKKHAIDHKSFWVKWYI